jgi:hypothetical protein
MFVRWVHRLIASWIFIAVAAVLLGFAGWLYPFCSLLLVLPVGCFAALFFGLTTSVQRWYREGHGLSIALVIALIGVWVLHFTNVLVPETGFDAVWYHLPIIAKFAAEHRIFYWPEFYQSLNPLASDLVFLLGWQVGGELGAKLIAFGFALSLVVVSFALARKFLSRDWSLLAVLMISLFQVVSWQSGSVYVDVAKAFWEVAALFFILEGNVVRSGFSFGLSLASKLFSLVLWPVMIMITLILRGWRTAMLLGAISLLVVLPFYLFTWQHVGTPFYSVQIHTAKLSEIGGNASPLKYIFRRTSQLPLIIKELSISRDYTTPLLVPLILLAVWMLSRKKWQQSRELWILLLFSFAQVALWWYLPPLSVRYALSGFITLLIWCLFYLEQFWEEFPQSRRAVVAVLAIGILFTLAPRIFVTVRNLKYIAGQQTKREYLEQFYDGNIDQKLDAWNFKK